MKLIFRPAPAPSTLAVLFMAFILSTSCVREVYAGKSEARAFISQLEFFNKADTTLYRKAINVIDSVNEKKDWLSSLLNRDTVLNRDDKEFMKGQIASDLPVVWDYSWFDTLKTIPIKFLPRSYIDSILKADPQKGERLSFISFSKPIFSNNKQYCLFYYSYNCGNLCAETAIRLYKKINNKWISVKTYLRVVS